MQVCATLALRTERKRRGPDYIGFDSAGTAREGSVSAEGVGVVPSLLQRLAVAFFKKRRELRSQLCANFAAQYQVMLQLQKLRRSIEVISPGEREAMITLQALQSEQAKLWAKLKKYEGMRKESDPPHSN